MNPKTGLFDTPIGAFSGAVKKQEKMTISARPIAFFADFSPMRALRWIFAAAVVAAVTAPGTPTPPGGPGPSGREPMTASGAWPLPPRRVIAVRPIASPSPYRDVAFRRPAAARSGAGSAAAASLPSQYRSAHPGRAGAVGSSAIRAEAGGAGSFPATAAAESGKPREPAGSDVLRRSVLPAAPQRGTSNGRILMWPL